MQRLNEVLSSTNDSKTIQAQPQKPQSAQAQAKPQNQAPASTPTQKQTPPPPAPKPTAKPVEEVENAIDEEFDYSDFEK